MVCKTNTCGGMCFRFSQSSLSGDILPLNYAAGGYFDNNAPDIIFNFLMCVKSVFFDPWFVFLFFVDSFPTKSEKSIVTLFSSQYVSKL